MKKLILNVFRLLFTLKIKCLTPGWRSVIVITGRDSKDCGDLPQLLATLPAKHFYNVPAIAIKKGCDISEIKQLPDEVLDKIREAVW